MKNVYIELEIYYTVKYIDNYVYVSRILYLSTNRMYTVVIIYSDNTDVGIS